MRRVLLITAICFLAIAGTAQTDEKKWNLGLHGGLSQYRGDLGDGFYNMDQASYAFAGLSVSRYMSRHFDASLFFSRGELGYINHNKVVVADRATKFLVRHNTTNLVLRFYFTGPKAIIRPYLFVGGGMIWYESVYENKTEDFVFSIPAGAGFNFRLGPVVSLQIQETLLATISIHINSGRCIRTLIFFIRDTIFIRILHLAKIKS